MSRYMQHLACRFHPHAVLIEDSRAGDMICPMCGLVVGERMVDVGSEWRTFANESDSVDMTRVGAAQNLLYDHDNLETTTSFTAKSERGAEEISTKKYGTKISQISAADKALREGHSAIRVVAARINLSKKVIDRAFLTYKTCYEKQHLRGRSKDAIVAACVYIACRNEGSTRTIDEICSISSVSSKEISQMYLKLLRVLPKESAPKMINIKDLVPRFRKNLNLEQGMIIERAAIRIAEQAKEVCDIQGRKPSSIAGASIYLACLAGRENVSKKDISKATGASEIVIREVYRILLLQASQLFPTDFIFKCPIADLPSA